MATVQTINSAAINSLNEPKPMMIQFGNFPPVSLYPPRQPPCEKHVTVTPTMKLQFGTQEPVMVPILKQKPRAQLPEGPVVRMVAEELKERKLFLEWEEGLAPRQIGLKFNEKLIINRRGHSEVVQLSKYALKRKRAREAKRVRKPILLKFEPRRTTLSISGGPSPSSEAIEFEKPKWPLNKVKSAKTRVAFKEAHLGKDELEKLLRTTIKIARARGMNIEYISRKATNMHFERKKSHTYAKVDVNHLSGRKKKCDLWHDDAQTEFLDLIAQYSGPQRTILKENIVPGWSGYVLKASSLKGTYSRFHGQAFIIRGRHEGKLYDARVKITKHMMHTMVHYSPAGERFWAGFDRAFIAYRTTDQGHQCYSGLDVTKCGEVAALMCLAMFPCGRITCPHCVNDNILTEGQATVQATSQKVNQMREIIKSSYPEFKHVVQILDRYELSLNNVNSNYKDFAEIQSLTDGMQGAAFPHANKLNAILIKGATATSEEFTQATKYLLEITRYMKNRTENIEKGSLKSFRNKVSQKAHVNPTLMCDNQRDKNGNFVWGERGYHAKRFFSNYFDIIDPRDGYDRYETRPNPNGSRRLAIGKLIVPTNFEALRAQMQGEQVEPVPITKECVSMLNGDYVHACCCVTTESGEPLLSELKMPTKHHLVIGNSGDPKYVDLPEVEENKMFVAKDGYCYINIFLAMLVNVDESKAKSFTKSVRDVLVDKLQKWPTLLDVATACYFLKVLYPDVANAELPRMLVDHKAKIIHVVDSYGSITTGYHVLKTNTVEQLIKFTRFNLESELKHYRVGGTASERFGRENLYNPDWNLKRLVKGIYRPEVLLEDMLWNPHIPLYAMLSPGVIIAFYNSGSLEALLQHYVKRDGNIALMLLVLKSLASKISVSQSVHAQIKILEKEASVMDEVRQRITAQDVIAGVAAHNFLQVLSDRSDANKELDLGGYTELRDRSVELMEKNYLLTLEDAWRELKWQDRIRIRWHSSKRAIFSRRNLPVKDTADLEGRYSESVTWFLAKPKQTLVSTGQKLFSMGTRTLRWCGRGVSHGTYRAFSYMIPDIFKFMNVLICFSLFVTIIREIHLITARNKETKALLAKTTQEKEEWELAFHHRMLSGSLGQDPTLEEFEEHLIKRAPHLIKVFKSEESVTHQAKRKSEQDLERIIAFVALVMMMFDSERSDCVAKVLQKLKTLMASAEPGVYHQSLDDIEDDLSERNLHVDFELKQDNEIIPHLPGESNFGKWWNHQITRGFTIPHYRTEGHFMTFTRETAVEVAGKIAHGTERDILLMGAVGSGKSTGLPYNLSKRGNVLLLEPTRPLAENVHKQLSKEPFHLNTTLRMRGTTAFGSAPVSIMTSGFALNYFANNRQRIEEFDFVIIDECHVHDANAMAFRCLLHECEYTGKIIKVSATPPGREVSFQTQYPVSISTEESMSLQDFASAQGSGSNADTTSKGDNILVYVASYNEVDTLANLLTNRGFKVTKVDGRTMKVGNVEIPTSGTEQHKHFIVATNIIENGVTLDIDVVADFGTKVVPSLDADNRMMSYTKVAISYGERIQRLGRVGRHKKGHALRIGHTEKGLSEIPSSIATEAAFRCFTFGLPVITNNVSVSILSHVTVRQARTMALFEISPFYMAHIVRFDGTMHPQVHALLTKFKLRDSEVLLNKLAIPSRGTSTWLTALEYTRLGANLEERNDVRIPFLCKEIPEKLHYDMWNVITKFKGDAGFGRLSSASASKIAYTLQTDVNSIQRTVTIINTLIQEERRKQEYFKTVTSNCVSSSNFSLQSITNAIKSRAMSDHTHENISILENARSQLLEFQNLNNDHSFTNLDNGISRHFMQQYGALESVHHQSTTELSKHLKLKGKWNKSLIAHDVLILCGVLGGGVCMLYNYFKTSLNEPVQHEGRNKRQRQKLKFRNARDQKMGHLVHADDETLEYHFGDAYTKKGKGKGRTRGMGHKTRRFINMYGFDPEDYSAVRFVDPLTGVTLDEGPICDISLVQEHFSKVREDYLDEDLIDIQQVYRSPGIQAYYTNKLTGKALKVDLTPHIPLKVCDKNLTIAGFPERETELRQTGEAKPIDITEVPKANESNGSVNHESTSMFRGLRDYNPISNNICHLTNASDGYNRSLYGVGFGPLILTNRHLFERNNGELIIQSRHGRFEIKNTTQLNLLPVPDRDLLIIRLPKDIPPFPQKLTFRQPVKGERICMVGSNFQTKSITSVVSETSVTMPVENSRFWKHWISTKEGQCGNPLVSTKDGMVLGLHSLANTNNSMNYFSAFPENFEQDFLRTIESHEWIKHWKYNTDHISWGPLDIKASQPKGLFKTSKLIGDLEQTAVYAQALESRWMYNKLEGNLIAIAHCPSQLVTKHTVKGKCQLFDLYLRLHDEEREYFQPFMGQYQKSRLNKEAYSKDLLKYATPIEAGNVDCDEFETVLKQVIIDLRALGFERCNYVTDEEDIFNALNMKSAVGALYQGKKKDFFADYTNDMKAEILKESCKRLYLGHMGVWNGSLKSELRPLEKVEANKTRTFTAAPIDTLLGGKTCVDDFNNQFYDLNLKGPWSVGMTKFYGGWNGLLEALPDGWIHCDADGSQFDSSLSPYLVNAVLQIRLEFMEEWDIGERMLQNLYTEIVYTPISTPDGTLVKKFKGNNSGQPSTVVDNTLMVILAVNYSLRKSGVPLELRDSMVKYFVNGDDLLISVRPDYEFILDTMAENFKQLGLKYTFDSRTREKGALWFMSHKGVKREGIWIPKLEEERIVSILEWDRSSEPAHRLEAICAAMIESWGYDRLTHEIRKFYAWVLEQAPFSVLAAEGKAPYIAEAALKKLYTNVNPTTNELGKYLEAIFEEFDEPECYGVLHQANETVDAGLEAEKERKTREDKAQEKRENKAIRTQQSASPQEQQQLIKKDKDVNAGTSGTFSVPRLKNMASKMRMPKFQNQEALNLDHLIGYTPRQTDLSNARATKNQFDTWFSGVMEDYEVDVDKMQIILNGLMVWCIENGTSPNINGVWVMMDGDEQVEFPIKPLIDHAKPTFRQIMAHFSDVAEAYIEKRNQNEPYMPRYGLQRNLTDMSLARYAFDFYEMTSRTPVRAKEAHLQMKAAALRGANNNLFGLDGNVGSTDENTERHTTDDVNRNMHTLMGVRGM
nr:polyprotein [hedge mustard mosaic virus]